MGTWMSQEEKREITLEKIFYYKRNSTLLSIADMSSPQRILELSFSIKNANPEVSYSIEGQMSYFKTFSTTIELGKTEEKYGREIKFETFFKMKYFFEREQFINFIVNLDKKEKVSHLTTLGQIIGKKGFYEKKLSEGRQEIFCVETKDSQIDNNKILIKPTLIFQSLSGILPVILIKRKTSDGNSVKVYRTEQKFPFGGTISFDEVELDLSLLAESAAANQIIELEAIDLGTDTVLGRNETYLKTLLNQSVELKMNKCVENADYCLRLETEMKHELTFFDYLKDGMKIALTIGIDFTDSNKDPSDPTSYHFTGAGQTQYEQAILSCGNIVAHYDADQSFPVYGFGAILEGEEKVNHCFSLDFESGNEIYGMDGVVKHYREALKKVAFHGPTNFCPLINKVIEAAKSSKNEMVYQVLLIVTDGVICDKEKTLDRLVRASRLPISVIIVGIGDYHFKEMRALDADDAPLYDKCGFKAERDLVQFVPYMKYKDNPSALAEEVLEEIPQQVVEYYQMKKVFPK